MSDVLLPPFGHQGLMHDVETGLIYNRARMLHPKLGRFQRRDPKGYVDGMNLYQDGQGGPVNRVDPMGTQSDDISYGLMLQMRLIADRRGRISPAFDLAGSVRWRVNENVDVTGDVIWNLYGAGIGTRNELRGFTRPRELTNDITGALGVEFGTGRGDPMRVYLTNPKAPTALPNERKFSLGLRQAVTYNQAMDRVYFQGAHFVRGGDVSLNYHNDAVFAFNPVAWLSRESTDEAFTGGGVVGVRAEELLIEFGQETFTGHPVARDLGGRARQRWLDPNTGPRGTYLQRDRDQYRYNRTTTWAGVTDTSDRKGFRLHVSTGASIQNYIHDNLTPVPRFFMPDVQNVPVVPHAPGASSPPLPLNERFSLEIFSASSVFE